MGVDTRSSPTASRARLRRKLRKLGFALSVVVIVSPAILVFLWMLSLSLKNEIDNLAYPPVFVPSPPTLANFVQVFSENSMGLYFWNSIVVSGLATLVALAVGIPAGYGIARANAHKLTVLILIAFGWGHLVDPETAVPWSTMLNLIISGYVGKVLYEAAATPLTYLVVNKLKRAEGVDVYDRDTNFNPFTRNSESRIES